MKEHGEFSYEWKEHVLHVYPKGGFNEFGIDALHNEIREVAQQHQSWVLIEHPKDGAGLTPEAAEALVKNYQALRHHGCIAVGLEVSRVWERIVTKALVNIDLPVYFAQNEELLNDIMKAHL